MIPGRIRSLRAALCTSISILALTVAAGTASAQTAPAATSAGDVSVDLKSGTRVSLPISSPAAVGSRAPAGSAPALAPAQASLRAFEPGSIVSDKVIRDLVPPTSDYNETIKYTPGVVSNNINGLLGDSKSGWRGFVDGQFNITFDGVPFGDANDPTHHSAAYFPGYFLGSVIADRGPGAASQAGYATFGGTLSLNSKDLTDTRSANVTGSYGSYNTQQGGLSLQTGLIGESGVRALVQYSHAQTDGAINYGKVNQNQYLLKLDKQIGDFKVTVFGNYGLENYNNVNPITYSQWQTYGKNYGQVNNNPRSQQYVGYNNSQKATDMEYIDVNGRVAGFRVDNKVYTYSYSYPTYQNNGADQTIEGNASYANGGSINSVSIPTITGGKIKQTINGVANGDVTGYIKFNNYRAYGDSLKVERDLDLGMFSGTVRTGIWAEQVDNERFQLYEDYTTGKTYTQLGASNQAAYKLNLASHITNVQPYIEYDWKPIEGLTITPGYKYESFTRHHVAAVNQTTLQPITYDHTYDVSLPFLAARYQVSDEVTVYAQASQGFLAPTVSAYYVFDPSVGGIKPQTTTNYQAGVVFKNERLTADIDIYQVTAENFAITTTTSTGQQYYVNSGTARYQGLEAEGSYSLFNGLSAFGSLALMDSRFIKGKNQGLRTPDAPTTTFSVGGIYDDGRFFGSALTKVVGDFYGSGGQTVSTATANSGLNHVSGYNTTDIVVGYRADLMPLTGVAKQATLKLGVYNVFDHKSVAEIGGSPSTLVQNDPKNSLSYSFLPGRLIYGSLSIDF